jgi:hypothetical protein
MLECGFYWVNQAHGVGHPDRWEPAFLQKDGRWLLLGEEDPIDQVQLREIGERILHIRTT